MPENRKGSCYRRTIVKKDKKFEERIKLYQIQTKHGSWFKPLIKSISLDCKVKQMLAWLLMFNWNYSVLFAIRILLICIRNTLSYLVYEYTNVVLLIFKLLVVQAKTKNVHIVAKSNVFFFLWMKKKIKKNILLEFRITEHKSGNQHICQNGNCVLKTKN